MGPSEAQLLARVGHFAWVLPSGIAFLFERYSTTKNDLPPGYDHGQLLDLVDAGCLLPLSSDSAVELHGVSELEWAGHKFDVRATHHGQISVHLFSRAGAEILKLVSFDDADPKYSDWAIAHFSMFGYIVEKRTTPNPS
ncbi:MAG: hypothetical protein AMXMBFR58_10130 [Phycisphaerae bacterium]